MVVVVLLLLLLLLLLSLLLLSLPTDLLLFFKPCLRLPLSVRRLRSLGIPGWFRPSRGRLALQ